MMTFPKIVLSSDYQLTSAIGTIEQPSGITFCQITFWDVAVNIFLIVSFHQYSPHNDFGLRRFPSNLHVCLL